MGIFPCLLFTWLYYFAVNKLAAFRFATTATVTVEIIAAIA